MSYYSTPEGKDPQLWHMARKRAAFKSHLVVYLLVNAGLWLLWYILGAKLDGNSIPWPAWTTFGWGIGQVAHYLGAYHTNGPNAIEKEYDKLSQKQPK